MLQHFNGFRERIQEYNKDYIKNINESDTQQKKTFLRSYEMSFPCS